MKDFYCYFVAFLMISKYIQETVWEVRGLVASFLADIVEHFHNVSFL
jgi:hypothetical protein